MGDVLKVEGYNNLMKDIHLEQKVEKLENIISGLLDEIITMSENYNIDIHNGESNYNYYKNEHYRSGLYRLIQCHCYLAT